ncbi:hypothetical protein B0H11DRAFT_2279309 [Mycena galericulata]|nr:hypothetical protein B0H11DRAFT_2279309 [Mycena galericulata]
MSPTSHLKPLPVPAEHNPALPTDLKISDRARLCSASYNRGLRIVVCVCENQTRESVNVVSDEDDHAPWRECNMSADEILCYSTLFSLGNPLWEPAQGDVNDARQDIDDPWTRVESRGLQPSSGRPSSRVEYETALKAIFARQLKAKLKPKTPEEEKASQAARKAARFVWDGKLAYLDDFGEPIWEDLPTGPSGLDSQTVETAERVAREVLPTPLLVVPLPRAQALPFTMQRISLHLCLAGLYLIFFSDGAEELRYSVKS